MASIKATGEPAVDPTVNLPLVSAPPSAPQSEWTTIPTRPPVRFPKNPTAPTQHMLVLTTKYCRGAVKPSIWNCFPCTENPPPSRYGERQEAIRRVYTAAGTFFAERGITLSSLNICFLGTTAPRNVELFFKSEEALWEADALAEEFSATFGGGFLRRLETGGKMVIFGVHPESFEDFECRTNLSEEHLRELEDLNPVFNSKRERVAYRIRNVHYMSGQATNGKLAKHGSTWSVTFSDFRIAELFIEGGGFRFFKYEGNGPPRWYEDRPDKRWNNTPAGSQAGRASSQASHRNGEPANNGEPGIPVQVGEGSKPQEAVRKASGVKGQDAAAAATNRKPKFGSASTIYTTGEGNGAAAVAAGQQSAAEVKDVGVAGASGNPQANEAAREEEAAKAAEAKLLKKRENTKRRNQRKKEKAAAEKAAAKLAAVVEVQGAGGAVANQAVAPGPRQG